MNGTDSDNVEKVKLCTSVDEEQILIREDELDMDILLVERVVVRVLEKLVKVCLHRSCHLLENQFLILDGVRQVHSLLVLEDVKELIHQSILVHWNNTADDGKFSVVIRAPFELVEFVLDQVCF